MKKLFLLILLFTLSCNQDSSSPSDQKVAAQAGDDSTSVVDESPSAPVLRTWTDEFVDLVNAHRSSIGLRTLIHSDGLADIARGHSQDMASGKVAFGHTGFSTRCSEARDVLGGGNWCAENVAAGQKTPEAAFNSWMNSSGHRANIESSKATHLGLGYAKNSSGKYYWTQIFLQN